MALRLAQDVVSNRGRELLADQLLTASSEANEVRWQHYPESPRRQRGEQVAVPLKESPERVDSTIGDASGMWSAFRRTNPAKAGSNDSPIHAVEHPDIP